MLASLTAAQCVYRLLQLNMAALAVAACNKDLLAFLIKHKQRAQVVFGLSVLLLLCFFQASYVVYKDRTDAPSE